MMAAYYYAAPEVERIAAQLIAKHHRSLAGIRIDFYFRSEASRSNGKLRLGQARKVTGLNALMATPDLARDPEASSEGCEFFTIEIAADTFATMTEAQRIGVVDHELTHCVVEVSEDGDAVLSMRPHDVQEFASVLVRNGLGYRPDTTQFFNALGSDTLSLWAQDMPEDEQPLRLVPPAGVSENGEVLSAAASGDEPSF